MIADGYDPFHIDQSAETSFEKKVGFFKIKRGARFDNGEVYGLSHLKRTDDATLSSNPTTISVRLGVDGDLHGGGHWKAWLSPIDISGSTNLKIQNIDIGVTISVNDHKGHIEELKFVHDPEVHVDVGNLGPLSWIAGQFTDSIVNMLVPWLSNLMLPRVKDFLQGELDKVTIPF